MTEPEAPCNPFAPGNVAVFAAVGALAFAGLAAQGSVSSGSAQEPMGSVKIGGREFEAPQRLASQIEDSLEFFTSRGEWPSAASAPALGRWLDRMSTDATRRLTRPKATAMERAEAKEELEHLSVLTHVYEAFRGITDGSIRARELSVQVGDHLLVGAAAPGAVLEMSPGSRWEVIYIGVGREVTLLRSDSIGRRRNAEPLLRVKMSELSTMLRLKLKGEPVLQVVRRGAPA